MATGQGGSKSQSRDEFRQLFSAITDVQGQLASMKEEISQGRAEADERLVKRLKLDKKTNFKRKGNELQHAFNEEVRDKLRVAASSIEGSARDIERAKKALEEGEALINERQKLIKIADRSEHGWATVEEYGADELADNSDDEKR